MSSEKTAGEALETARCSGVIPFASARSSRAPAASNDSMRFVAVVKFPFSQSWLHIVCNGVRPARFVALICAPCSTSHVVRLVLVQPRFGGGLINFELINHR